MTDHKDHAAHTGNAHARSAYLLFALNMLLSFVAMYLLMYAMIDGWADFFHNLNMGYMALTMLAAMGIIMLATMPSMFPRKRLNVAIYAILLVGLVLAFACIRTQRPIGDEQFIASMIPHHSGAILMCREAQLTDAELIELCRGIAEGQRQEIDQMRSILARL
jgi:uncharacterized protein (DUF305 family)